MKIESKMAVAIIENHFRSVGTGEVSELFKVAIDRIKKDLENYEKLLRENNITCEE